MINSNLGSTTTITLILWISIIANTQVKELRHKRK